MITVKRLISHNFRLTKFVFYSVIFHKAKIYKKLIYELRFLSEEEDNPRKIKKGGVSNAIYMY